MPLFNIVDCAAHAIQLRFWVVFALVNLSSLAGASDWVSWWMRFCVAKESDCQRFNTVACAYLDWITKSKVVENASSFTLGSFGPMKSK